jgi:hypothetical protein
MDLEPRQMKEDGGCLGLLDTCFAKDDKSWLSSVYSFSM